MTKDILIQILMGSNPGTKLRYYGETGIVEFDRLTNLEQDPKSHPEIFVKTHVCYVLDAMSHICNKERLNYDHKLTLMLAAFCHDMGKYVSTFFHREKNKLVSYGHDITSQEITEELLKRYELDDYMPVVSKLVRHHMIHCQPQHTEKSVKKLINNLSPAKFEDLILLCRADCAGRPPLSPDLPETITKQLIPIYKKITDLILV